jgi:hypothetical protein
MPEGIRTLNLQFVEKDFVELKTLKEKSGAPSWEKFIKNLAGMRK